MEEKEMKRMKTRYRILWLKPHFFIMWNVSGSPLFFNAQFEIIVYNL